MQSSKDFRQLGRYGTAPFLTEDETCNLTIRAGTLTAEERQTINYHIVATIKMLEALPWPKHLANVPEYAGGHHERMDGKGYPKGLLREQMSVQARCMGIADIFEALTAKDRPYKKGKTLSESLDILGGDLASQVRLRLRERVGETPGVFFGTTRMLRGGARGVAGTIHRNRDGVVVLEAIPSPLPDASAASRALPQQLATAIDRLGAATRLVDLAGGAADATTIAPVQGAASRGAG